MDAGVSAAQPNHRPPVALDVTRYLAAAGPLLAGWLIVSLGGVSMAASIIGLSYLLGLLVTPFAAPETKGRPLPA